MKPINRKCFEKLKLSQLEKRKLSAMDLKRLDDISLLKLALARKNGKTIKIKLCDL